MSIIDEIKKQTDLIALAQKIKENFSHLKIDWETDVSKMDFDKLYSGNIVKGCSYLRMDKIKIEPNPDKQALLSSADEIIRIANLVELVDNGTKIIPPTFIHECFIRDGVKVVEDVFYQIDGAHRKALASYLQLTEIPIVVFERASGYQFTPDKWRFEQKQIRKKTPGGHQTMGSYIEAISTDGEIFNITPNNRRVCVIRSNIEFIEIQII